MHPILFKIGTFYVGTYGLMIVLGLIAALGLALYFAKKRGLPGEFFYDLAFLSLVSGFLGARVLFIIVNFHDFLKDPLPMLLSRSGFVFLGGFAAAAIAAIWLIRKREMPMWEVGDICAPCLALAHAFGRIGCFFAGCCYGRVVSDSFPLGLRFPRFMDTEGNDVFSFAFQDHRSRGLVDPMAMASAPVLPTQLFESGANFIICGLLLVLWARRKFTGQVFLAYLVLYGSARFGLEFLRGDADRGLLLGLVSTSQILSLAAIAIAIFIWSRRRNDPEAQLLEIAQAPEPISEPPLPKSRPHRPARSTSGK